MKQNIKDIKAWATQVIKFHDPTARLDIIEIYSEVGIQFLTGKKPPLKQVYLSVPLAILDKTPEEIWAARAKEAEERKERLHKAVEKLNKKKEAAERKQLITLLKKYPQ